MIGQSCYVSEIGNYLGRALALVTTAEARDGASQGEQILPDRWCWESVTSHARPASVVGPKELFQTVLMSRTRSEANGGGFHYNHYITGQSLPPHQSRMQATLWSGYSVKEIEERYRYKWILWLWVQSVVRCGNPQIWTHPDSDIKCKPQNNPQINTHQESHHVTSQNMDPDHN